MAPGPAEAFNEAFLWGGDEQQLPARVVCAPWMTRLEKREDASLLEMAETSVLHEETARYVWDGEEAIGLIERCTLKNGISG